MACGFAASFDFHDVSRIAVDTPEEFKPNFQKKGLHFCLF